MSMWKKWWSCLCMEGEKTFIRCSGFLLILLVESIVHKVLCIFFVFSFCFDFILPGQMSVFHDLYLLMQGPGWFFRAWPQSPALFTPQCEDCASAASPYRLQKEAGLWKQHPRIVPPSFREEEEVWWLLWFQPGYAELPLCTKWHPRKAHHKVGSEQVRMS